MNIKRDQNVIMEFKMLSFHSPERHPANVEQELLLALGDLLGKLVLKRGVEGAHVFKEGRPLNSASAVHSVLGIETFGFDDGGSAVHGGHRLHLADDGGAALEHVHAAASVWLRPPHSPSSPVVLSPLAGIISPRGGGGGGGGKGRRRSWLSAAAHHNCGGGGLSPSSRGIRTSLAETKRDAIGMEKRARHAVCLSS